MYACVNVCVRMYLRVKVCLLKPGRRAARTSALPRLLLRTVALRVCVCVFVCMCVYVCVSVYACLTL
jgi:hypothetical protein